MHEILRTDAASVTVHAPGAKVAMAYELQFSQVFNILQSHPAEQVTAHAILVAHDRHPSIGNGTIIESWTIHPLAKIVVIGR